MGTEGLLRVCAARSPRAAAVERDRFQPADGWRSSPQNARSIIFILRGRAERPLRLRPATTLMEYRCRTCDEPTHVFQFDASRGVLLDKPDVQRSNVGRHVQPCMHGSGYHASSRDDGARIAESPVHRRQPRTPFAGMILRGLAFLMPRRHAMASGQFSSAFPNPFDAFGMADLDFAQAPRVCRYGARLIEADAVSAGLPHTRY